MDEYLTELDKWYGQYYEVFGDGFPSYQLARGRSDDEVIAIIKQCLEAKKDVYELGLATLDDDTEY